MKCDSNELHDAVSWAAKHTARQAHFTALSGLLLNAEERQLVIRATDLTAHVAAMVDSDGNGISALVPAERLAKISARAKGHPTEITQAKDVLTITAGRRKWEIRCLDQSEWPEQPELDAKPTTVKPGVWAALVECAAPAVSRDRQILTGVYAESRDGTLTLVATDSYRLHHASTRWGGPDGQANIPVVPLLSSARWDSPGVDVMLGESQARFIGHNRDVQTSLIEGRYPDWRRLIPERGDCETAVEVRSEDLVGAIADAAAAAPRVNAQGKATDNAMVTVDIADGAVMTSATDAGSSEGESEVEAEVEGPPITIGFSDRYIIEAVQAVSTEFVRLEIRDPTKPVMVYPVDPLSDIDRYALAMPVRL